MSSVPDDVRFRATDSPRPGTLFINNAYGRDRRGECLRLALKHMCRLKGGLMELIGKLELIRSTGEPEAIRIGRTPPVYMVWVSALMGHRRALQVTIYAMARAKLSGSHLALDYDIPWSSWKVLRRNFLFFSCRGRGKANVSKDWLPLAAD